MVARPTDCTAKTQTAARGLKYLTEYIEVQVNPSPLIIKVYTNKQILVRVYLDKGRVSHTNKLQNP